MHLFVAGLALACLAAPRVACAQRFPPRILLVFDTSGSMGVDLVTGEPTGGDNSAEHPGTGGTSRLFVAKNAIATLVETTSEVEFALMRYPQLEGAGINRGPIDGFNQQTYTGLAERPLNYAGTCEGALRPAADAAHALLVPFGRAAPPAILGWLDHHEAWPADPELRATGPTPIDESLRLAAEYLGEVMAADPGVRCRQTYVVLLTDGGESCVPAADRDAALVARAQALRRLPVVVDGEVIERDVRTFVVAFGVSITAAQRLGVLAEAGGTAVGGLPYQAEDLAGLRRAFGQVLREAIPVERCNDADDDCDGVIDEGARNACGGCGPAPVEVCNRRDDDCDGRVDEGALNACGGCGAVPDEVCNAADDDCDGRVDETVADACGGCGNVRDEICNGEDDDCDGRVDNVPGGDAPLARPCGSEVGACTPGFERCVEGAWAACDGVAAADEACNGLDDDCDGRADEDTRPCGPAVDIGDVGECRVGARRCDPAACDQPDACAEDGWLAACEGAIGPADEVCDGRDNDCDGALDEGLINGCGFCGPPPPEACNGLDDNCDGRVDEDAACPNGFVCFAGECAAACDSTGECAAGFTCVNVYPGGRFCHPDPCAGVRCPAGTRCDAEAGGCVDPCADVECGADEACDLGDCVPATCRHTGCPPGERCVDDACVADPCAGVECDRDHYCREGACVRACFRTVCGEGQACLDGVCAPDPCGGRCLRGQRCDAADGACVADPCGGVACPPGQACFDGACRGDAPCVHLTCPTGTTCADEGCTDFAPGVPPPGAPRPLADAAVVDIEGDGEPPVLRPRDAGVADAARDPDAAPPAGGGSDDGGCGVVPGRTGGGDAVWALGLLAWALRRRRAAVLGVALLGGCSPSGPPSAAPDAARATPDAAPRDAGPADAASRARPDGGEQASAYDRVKAYFAERDQLDEQVWKDEVEAQRHETAFVELWDALRGAEDPAAVLAAFPVGALTVGDPAEPQRSADGVTEVRLSASPRTLDQAAWKALVLGLAEDGYRLRQSEWHHVAFRPSPPRSTVKAELHLSRPKSNDRLILRLRLGIDWKPSVAPATPRPARVDATDAVLTRRRGAPTFVATQRLPIGAHSPTPVLAADLGGDGRIEVIVPRANAVFRPTKDGAWLRLTLTNHPLAEPDAGLLADLDGDGHLDLLVAGKDAERNYRLGLYRGDSGGLFPDPPRVAFAPEEPLRRARVLTAGDIDGDGDLDLFVGQYKGAYHGGSMPTPFYDADDGFPSYVLRNDGEGHFTDITAEAGLTTRRHRHSQSGSFVDLDLDGDLDLVTVNDFSGVDLFANDGKGHFADVTAARVDNRSVFGMAHALGDFDADGRLDLFATGMSSSTVRRLNSMQLQRTGFDQFTHWRTEITYGNRLYLGQPDGRLQQADFQSGASASGWSWGTVAFDRENDGDLDLFVANGFRSGDTARDYCTQYWRQDIYFDADALGDAASDIAIIGLQTQIESGVSWNGFEHNRLYVRHADGYREEGHLWGLGSEADSRNVLAFDYDEDGRVDLFVAEARGQQLALQVWHNEAPAAPWIGVKLQGRPGHPAEGAQVRLIRGAERRVAAVVTGDSFLVQHPAQVHFGLGAGPPPDAVEISWPGGKTSRLERPAPGRYHVAKAP